MLRDRHASHTGSGSRGMAKRDEMASISLSRRVMTSAALAPPRQAPPRLMSASV
jgi:hypothetical protein